MLTVGGQGRIGYQDDAAVWTYSVEFMNSTVDITHIEQYLCLSFFPFYTHHLGLFPRLGNHDGRWSIDRPSVT